MKTIAIITRFYDAKNIQTIKNNLHEVLSGSRRNITEHTRGVDFAHYIAKMSLCRNMPFIETREGDTDTVNSWVENGIKPFYFEKTCGYYNKLNPSY